ncbi:hypothetical protein MWH25_06460 [Natroniella acetigena]|uniref:hypothetical protein n=1 Tax=Natroniella acetigena TaxID=52004 RepID=UPI00200AA289|nr:hypothetical protein [Natroniella acetigena]MCK8827385.1 hypothetical protein [Natroniella acetigena]
MITQLLTGLIDKSLKVILLSLILLAIFILMQIFFENLSNNPNFLDQLPSKLIPLLRQLPRLNGLILFELI